MLLEPQWMLRLLAALVVVQAISWCLARLLGARLRREAIALGLLLPWILLWPWIAGAELVAPTQALAGQIPGTASSSAELDGHSRELNDVVFQLLPWELEVRKAYGARRWPFWSDRLDGGSSLWANPQTGVLCPLANAARLLPVQHHYLGALAAKMLVALQGMWVLTRRLGVRRAPALASAVAFALGGAILPWALFVHSTSAAWAPWCAASALAIARPRGAGERLSGRRGAAVGTALVFAALLVGGQPEVAFSAGALAVVVAASLARRRRRTRTLAVLLLAGSLGAALAAPVVLPFVRLLPHSQRAQEHLERTGEAAAAPGPWFEEEKGRLLLAPLNPHAFGEPFSAPHVLWTIALSGYAGLTAFLGCVLLVAARRRRRRALPFLLFAVVAMLLATEFRPLVRLWYLVPPLRLPETTRFFMAAALGLTAAGAVGLDALWRRRRRRLVFAALAALACAVSLALSTDRAAVLPWILLLAAAALARPARLRAALLLAAVLVELVPWARRFVPRGDPALFFARTPEIEAVIAETPALYRAIGQDYLSYPSVLPFYGVAEPRALNPLLPAEYVVALRAGFGFNPSNEEYFSPVRRLDHPLRRFFGVRTIVSNAYLPTPPAADSIWNQGLTRLYRDTKALPRLFTTAAVDVVEHERLEQWFEAMRDPRRVAVMAHEVEDWRLPDGFVAAPLEIARFEPGWIEIGLPPRGVKLVATSIPGPRGWRAEGGGRALRTLTLNGAFLGVAVPPRIERVTLRYRPPGLREGVAAAGLSLLCLAAVALAPASWLRPRRLRDGALFGAAMWFCATLALEIDSRHSRHQALERVHPRLPSRWVWGSPPPERLRSLLAAADTLLPEERCEVGFVSGWSGGQALSPRLWAAYFLPRCDVVPLEAADAAGPELRIVLGAAPAGGTMVEVASLPGGALYRRAP